MSKLGMARVALGVAAEHQHDNIAGNTLWPRTIIESQASIGWKMADRSQWRTPEIVCDASLAIFAQEPRSCSGHQWIDENALTTLCRNHGIRPLLVRRQAARRADLHRPLVICMPTALVLSAGAMFGAYQAGVWNVLSQRCQLDMVVGTSVGALNWWAIAGGCSAEELSAMWLDPSTGVLMRTRLTWRIWKGLIDPAALERRVRDWYARFPLRTPYSTTIVELPGMRLVRVPGEQVRPEHLMASCAVPFGYPPVLIDGRRYVDGGLLDILPVWAAVEMGATRVIAVNVLPLKAPAALRAALRVAYTIGEKPPVVSGPEVLMIRPRTPLGSLHETVSWTEERTRRWIRRGEEDAAAVVSRL